MPDDRDPARLPAAQPAVRSNAITSLPRVLDSARLFDGAREVLIQHAGSEYRLRLTQFNKLILTK